jgi:hypothetical protein
MAYTARYTVLKFTFIEFDTNWERTVPSLYRALSPASQLLVVAEDANGVKTTYLFQATSNVPGPQGNNLYVHVSEHCNIVSIPARCLKRWDGDKTACGRVGFLPAAGPKPKAE